MSRRVRRSVFGVAGLEPDEREHYAARLLLSGFDVEAAAAVTGLQLDAGKAIAEALDPDELKGAPPS
jgi:hypothetical protein